ncbi:MogA/MoaB family molybdenum cofactor biosynthesis protein [Cerasibacillus terrae]|uniref:Molybdenum cofactor biosynthesis protein B n=1 Tax=Cerasibacillus terrae TaxID=2498845 RepID=A0A5C8NGU5_9BACI|nr:MogA/MoaB family molybdenum cofactor biosynthesis protein [Cerasibacillus terrae]TXL60528.1 MogA/MoaB family molybdenum cofactor biosynthesis protein [Cerasibacillus terrae]
MSVHEHKRQKRVVHVMIVTISDTRTLDTDKSGKVIEKLLKDNGHSVFKRVVVKDEVSNIREAIEVGLHHPEVDAILTNGGTGIAYRDVTIETVESIIEKEIPGFGEIFRLLSYEKDIGSAAILSRAIAGVANHTAVFSMPGSSGAVTLGMNKLILPELSHVVNEIKKDIS